MVAWHGYISRVQQHEFKKRGVWSALIGSSLISCLYSISLCGFDDVISTSHLENPITHYNTCVLLSDSLSISSLDGRTLTQRKLSDAIEEMQFNSFLNSCSLADKARLLSVSSPYASAWISVITPQLGTTP